MIKKEMTSWWIIALLSLFVRAAEYNLSCYTDNDQVIGSDIGSQVDDLTTIQNAISILNADYRSAAIKTCTQTSSGDLLGHQIAIVDYTQLAQAMPQPSEVLWLPGIGSTLDSATVTCESVYLNRTTGVEGWHMKADKSGVYYSYVMLSNGTHFGYGNSNNNGLSTTV